MTPSPAERRSRWKWPKERLNVSDRRVQERIFSIRLLELALKGIVAERIISIEPGVAKQFVVRNRSTLSEVDEKLLISRVDGILMDLGVSFTQVNNANSGFSVLCD
ncbi:MraW methylase family protein [Tanacetum coccineum]